MQQLPAVKRLVKMGANINAQDSKGRTGLAVAAYQVFFKNLRYCNTLQGLSKCHTFLFNTSKQKERL